MRDQENIKAMRRDEGREERGDGDGNMYEKWSSTRAIARGARHAAPRRPHLSFGEIALRVSELVD